MTDWVYRHLVLLQPNHTLVRYAALYMLYSLYFKQPCRPMVKIRLTMQDFQDLQALTAAAKLEAHWDVMYAWAKVDIDRH